jgi:hypothetical protein
VTVNGATRNIQMLSKFFITLNSQPRPRRSGAIVLGLVLICLILPSATWGQATQTQQSELDLATANVNRGNVGARDAVVIANAAAVEEIPALENQFRRSNKTESKLSIASALVKLKDRDDTYWKFLLEQATTAVDSDVPDAMFSESQGRLVPLGPELQAWADAHNVSLNAAGIHARYDFPADVMYLAMTGDPRGIPLLQRALQSRNYLIVIWAAKGLAQAQDKNSIPMIIAAAHRAPIGYSNSIADSLVYFDDANAQDAVNRYVPKDEASKEREARARGRGAFGW